MRAPRILRVVAGGVAAAVAVSLAVVVPTVVVRAGADGPGPGSCAAPHAVDRRLPNGTRWQFCWHVGGLEGLVLTDVRYVPAGGPPHRVLARLALAEMLVSYDDGSGYSADVAGYGLDRLMTLGGADCPRGRVLAAAGRPGQVCLAVRSRGVAYRTAGAALAGDDLVISVTSEAAWYTYVAEYRFGDDGSITPRVGATGSLNPEPGTDPGTGWPVGPGDSRIATNHTHAAYWRIDPDVEGGAPDVVEQFDSEAAGQRRRPMRVTALTTESSARAASMRFWRVRDPEAVNADGHPVSWEVDVDGVDHYTGPTELEPFTADDLYVTRYRDCERLVLANLANDCAGSLDRYVDGEQVDRPVLWARVDFHHVPRDEDEDPMPTHWQAFRIGPRDVTARSPLPTPGG